MATINEFRSLAHVVHGFEIAVRSEIGFCNHFNQQSEHLIEMMCSRFLDILAEYQMVDFEFTDFLLGWLFADKLMGRVNPNHSFMNTLIEAHFEKFGKVTFDSYQGEISLSV